MFITHEYVFSHISAHIEYSSILQILSLLHQPNKQIAKHFLRVACSTIVNMSTSSPELTEKYIIKPLLKPILSCTQDNCKHKAIFHGYIGLIIDISNFRYCFVACRNIFCHVNRVWKEI